jgi:hypothetical protein
MPPLPSKSNGNDNSEPGRPGPGALLVCAALAAVTWLAILPQLGSLPAVRALIRRNESLGIDPSAKFYSELPAMPRLIDQVRFARRNEGHASASPARVNATP